MSRRLALLALLAGLAAPAAGAVPNPQRCEWFADTAMDVCRATWPEGLDRRLASAACGVASVRAYELCMKPDVWSRVIAAQKRQDWAAYAEIVASGAGTATAAGCEEALDLVEVKPSCPAWGERAAALLRTHLREALAARGKPVTGAP